MKKNIAMLLIVLVCDLIYLLLDKKRKQKKENLISVKKNKSSNKEISTILIDGTNVIRTRMYRIANHQKPDYKLEDSCLFPILYSKVFENLTLKYDRIVIFLDGKKRFFNIPKSQNVQIEFSNAKKADDLIVNDIITMKNIQPNIDKNITLVSEDKKLINRCKKEFNNLNIMKSYNLINKLGIHKTFYPKQYFNKGEYNLRYAC